MANSQMIPANIFDVSYTVALKFFFVTDLHRSDWKLKNQTCISIIWIWIETYGEILIIKMSQVHVYFSSTDFKTKS